MKPVLIQCRGKAFMCLHPRSVFSTGRQLQIIYETGKIRFGQIDIEQENFDWPWRVDIGCDSRFAMFDEDMVIF